MSTSAYAVAFELTSRLDNMEAYQGVASDGTHLYNTSATIIYKRTKAGSLVTSHSDAHLDGTDMAQVNHITYYDNKLYIGSSNYDTTPKKGYIKVFNCSDLSYVEEHQVKDYWCEGCAFYDNAWWVIYYGWSYISKYNASWEWQADYELTFSTQAGGYDGVVWIGDYLYCNIHDRHDPLFCDVYYWNGSGFDRIIRLDRPAQYCGQGFGKEPGEDFMWWAERVGAGEYNIVKSTISYGEVFQPSDKDTFINEASADTNYGDWTALYVRQLADNSNRALLEFDTSSLPADATILSAHLQLYYGAWDGADPDGTTIWAYKLSRTDWVELQATWNIYKTGSNWTAAGGDYVTSSPSGGSAEVPGSSGWMSWDILDIVQDAYDGSISVELLLMILSSPSNERPIFHSNNHTTTTLRPKLVIAYQENPSVDTDACTGITFSSLTANGEVTDAGEGAITRRGFGYTTVYDTFEWGSDADALTDDGGDIDWSALLAGSSVAEIDTAQYHGGTRSARLYRDGANSCYAYLSQTAGSTYDIDFWARKEDAGGIYIMHGNGTKRIRLYAGYTDELIKYIDDGGTDSTGVSVPVGEWYHITITNIDFTNGKYDVYLNGQLVQTCDMYSDNGATNLLYFGNAGDDSQVWLDDVYIFTIEDESGAFVAEEYDLELTGLSAATSYQVQAFAENDTGIGFGGLVTGTTCAAGTIILPIAASVIPTISATYNRTRTSGASLTVAPAISRAMVAIRSSINSGLTAPVSISRVLAATRTVANGLTAALSIARSRNRDYNISPSLTVAATISRALAIGRASASGLTAALSVARSRNRTYSISVGLSAFLTIINRLANEIAISCGLVVSTSATVLKGFVRSLTANATVATAISTSRGWTETVAANLNLTAAISRVVTFVRASASSLTSISSFSIDWSAITDTLITIGANLSVGASVVYQWAAKRTISPGLTLTAAISRTVTKTRSVAVSLTAAVSFLINEAVGRALKVITTVSHVFSIKTVVSHAKKIITREGD